MNSVEHDHAALYALGLMDPTELPAFERRLAEDSELRQLVDDLRETTAALASTVPAMPPPPTLRASVMAAIKDHGQDRAITSRIPLAPPAATLPVRRSLGRTWSGVGWGIAALLAIACGVLWNQKWALEKMTRDALANLAETKQAMNQFRERDALARMEITTLKSSLQEYQQGIAVVVWDSDAHQGVLKLEKMPPVAPQKDYQLWVIDPNKPAPVDAGVVKIDEAGFATVTFKPVQSVDTAAKFALSIEKEGGVPAGEGPVVLITP